MLNKDGFWKWFMFIMFVLSLMVVLIYLGWEVVKNIFLGFFGGGVGLL